ncbi:MAG TPA: AI-2E family transporter, partial [Phycisphaerae bacterium]|nr:AI-2E family transporter [Phycisphaerae bacterium]
MVFPDPESFNDQALGGQASGPPAADHSGSQVRLRQGLTVAALSLLIMMLCYLILRELTSILQPLMIAMFLCYLFVPAHYWLVRCHIPSLVAHTLVVGVVLLISYTVANMTYRSISEMSKDLPSYVVKFEDITDRIALDIRTRFHEMLRHRDDKEEDGAAGPAGPTGDATRSAEAATSPANATTRPGGSARAPEAEPARLQIISADRVIALGRSGVEAFVGVFTSALVVAVYLIFLLAEAAGFRRRVAGAFGTERAERILAVTDKINKAVAQYILVKTLTSLLIGGITLGILWAFGIQYAALWAILTFLANFIPYIGSMFAVALPILMSVIQFGNMGTPATLLGLLTIAQCLIAYFVEPRLVGRKLGVSPLMILLSLAFWGFLWGIPGMILSAPLI